MTITNFDGLEEAVFEIMALSENFMQYNGGRLGFKRYKDFSTEHRKYMEEWVHPRLKAIEATPKSDFVYRKYQEEAKLQAIKIAELLEACTVTLSVVNTVLVHAYDHDPLIAITIERDGKKVPALACTGTNGKGKYVFEHDSVWVPYLLGTIKTAMSLKQLPA